MKPEPGREYAFNFTSRTLEPVAAGVALPLGSLVRFSTGYGGSHVRELVVVDDIPTRNGQRAIERGAAAYWTFVSRSEIERNPYAYALLEGRAPLPEVCQLVATCEEVKLAAELARSRAKDRADRARAIGRNLVAQRPSWAVAAIVAELEVDKSDAMTDYFATSTERTVFLAWSSTKRDNFAEMRKAAALFTPTKHLTTPPVKESGRHPEDEHREKWSMGAGYYLKAGSRYSSGWKVRKTYPEALEMPLGLAELEAHEAFEAASPKS